VTIRIVYADDDEPYRRLLRAAFGMLPEFEVVGEACDGGEAVALALVGDADAVLLDVEMPVLDGFEAAEQIRQARPETRVLLHTGELLEERRARAGELDLVLLDKLQVYRTIELLSPSPTGQATPVPPRPQ
jgi:DNA-binding NarL/FixJ family response regulator